MTPAGIAHGWAQHWRTRRMLEWQSQRAATQEQREAAAGLLADLDAIEAAAKAQEERTDAERA